MTGAESTPEPVSQDLPQKIRQKPVSVLLPDLGIYRAGWLELIGVFGICGLGLTRIIWVWNPPQTNIWLLVVIAGFVLGLARFFRRLNWESTRMTCGEAALTTSRRGHIERTVPYEEITAIRFSDQAGEDWMAVETRDGVRMPFQVHALVQSKPSLKTDLVRAIGPKLGKEVVFDHGRRPDSPLAALEFDHRYRIPPVDMRQGTVYRYRFPEAIKSAIGYGANGFADALSTVVSGATALTLGWHYLWVMVVSVIVGLVSFRGYVSVIQVAKCLGDRLELVDEGIRVTRGDRSWIVPGLTSGEWKDSGVRLAGGAFLRYGKGRESYTIDPRLIEPDV